MFNTIVYGLRSMPAYGYQLNTEDVWSIIHYVRALQRSQNATFNAALVSLKVAKKLNISSSTISRALTNPNLVAKKTRKFILSTI